MTRSDPTVFVIDDDRTFLDALVRSLRGAGLRVTSFGAAEPFLEGCMGLPTAVWSRTSAGGAGAGSELQQTLAERRVSIPIVFVTGTATRHGGLRVQTRCPSPP